MLSNYRAMPAALLARFDCSSATVSGVLVWSDYSLQSYAPIASANTDVYGLLAIRLPAKNWSPDSPQLQKLLRLPFDGTLMYMVLAVCLMCRPLPPRLPLQPIAACGAAPAVLPPRCPFGLGDPSHCGAFHCSSRCWGTNICVLACLLQAGPVVVLVFGTRVMVAARVRVQVGVMLCCCCVYGVTDVARRPKITIPPILRGSRAGDG